MEGASAELEQLGNDAFDAPETSIAFLVNAVDPFTTQQIRRHEM